MKTILALFLSFFMLWPVAHAGEDRALKSGVFDPPRLAPDFVLAGSNGANIELNDYRGKLVALGFGFSHCPSVCPLTLANLAQVRKKLCASANELQVVYVTVDPERDTATRLQHYLANFDPAFVGATGTPEQLAAVRQAYGIAATKAAAANDASNYTVHHSSYIYLIDREGRLRALVPFGKSVDDIVHDVKILLQQ